MKLSRIAVLGGGPGGLYAARLLKLAHEGAQVDVYERGEADSTFGFGVGLAATTQRNLGAADRQTFEDILAVAWPHEMSMEVKGRTASIGSDSLRAIARTDLLRILQKHASDAGVRLHYGSRVQASDLVADLVIAADGAASNTREKLVSELGATVEMGRGLYLWCGTTFALPRALFSPVTTEHGTFVTHAYPYARDRSTFLIETDEATWKRAGFDKHVVAPEDSDDASLSYLQKAFHTQLQGHALLGNRTRWLRFRTVSCARWHHRNVVLLGDAAHTAHYSIGSGTKLAMEDAIALRSAIDDAGTLEEALTIYEARRRGPVEYLQNIARRSQAWWDAFPERLHLPVERLMVAYMTRAGKVTLEHFREKNPSVVAEALRAYRPGEVSGDLVPWVLEGKHDDRGMRIECDVTDAWSAAADALVERARSHAHVLLTGSSDRERVLDRLELAERLKHAGVIVTAAVPSSCLADAAAALVSDRIDHYAIEESA